MAFNTLMDSYLVEPNPGPVPTDSNGGASMGAGMGPSPRQNVAAMQGTPPLTGSHNTPLQVAFLGLISLAIVILLRRAGFRFAVAGKLSAGGR